MVGLGEPREVRAGVVGGSYFDVMGLHPVLGRLLDMRDDGPNAAGAAVLTYRFWKTTLNSDPSVIGKTVRLGTRSATVVGVLEPSVPYPAETEIIANVVTSPHHLSATMVTGRVHRMTEYSAARSRGRSRVGGRAARRPRGDGGTSSGQRRTARGGCAATRSRRGRGSPPCSSRLGPRLRGRVLERRQPDSRGRPGAKAAGRPRPCEYLALRRTVLAESLLLRRAPSSAC
jgi:hypothetical protein